MEIKLIAHDTPGYRMPRLCRFVALVSNSRPDLAERLTAVEDRQGRLRIFVNCPNESFTTEDRLALRDKWIATSGECGPLTVNGVGEKACK